MMWSSIIPEHAIRASVTEYCCRVDMCCRRCARQLSSSNTLHDVVKHRTRSMHHAFNYIVLIYAAAPQVRAAADREWAAREGDAAVMFATSREETRNADSEEYNVLRLSLDAQARARLLTAADTLGCRRPTAVDLHGLQIHWDSTHPQAAADTCRAACGCTSRPRRGDRNHMPWHNGMMI